MPLVTYRGVEYPVSTEENLLEGLIDGQAPVVFSCRKGSCRTCMLQTAPENLSKLSTNRLPQNFRDAGMFLPCITRCLNSLEVQSPDWTTCFVEALVVQKEQLEDGSVRVTLEPPLAFNWGEGQAVELRSDTGSASRYAIVSHRTRDYYLELLVPRTANDPVCRWVAEVLRAKDCVYVRGPLG